MRQFSTLLGLGLSSALVQAAVARTLGVTAIVPVSCAAELARAQIEHRRATLEIRRRCNTPHRIVITGPLDGALGDVTVRYNDVEVTMQSGFQAISHPGDYYHGVDRVVIEVTDGTAEDLRRYVRSFSIGIETA